MFKKHRIALIVVGLVVVMLQLNGTLARVAQSEDAKSLDTIDVQYAQAQLKLAEANLLKVERMNERIAKAVPADLVAEYRQDVAVAKAQLQSATGEGEAAFQVWLRRAEAFQKSAEADWKSAAQAGQRVRGTVDPLDIERLRLRAEVARLQWERGQSLAGQAPEAQVQWQISLVNDEVQRLREELRNPPSSRVMTVWRY